jgi:cytochrome c553
MGNIRLVSAIACTLALVSCSFQTHKVSETPAQSELCSTCLQLCSACHYTNGTTPGPEFPKIAGQYDVYLVKAVEDFKSGKRDSATMQRVASLHSKQEMIKLARYFASLPSSNAPAVSKPDETLWEWGKILFETERVYGISCADCHGDDAMGYRYKSQRMTHVHAIPRLAGQRRQYLASVLESYQKGEVQSGMCTMRKAGQTLSDNDIKALAEYLASLPPPS